MDSNQKFYINKEAQERECGMCREIMSFSNFHISRKFKNGNVTYQPYCKPCRSKWISRREQERKIEKNPDRFYECSNEGCGNIWSKHYHIRTKNICPKCGEKGGTCE